MRRRHRVDHVRATPRQSDESTPPPPFTCGADTARGPGCDRPQAAVGLRDRRSGTRGNGQRDDRSADKDSLYAGALAESGEVSPGRVGRGGCGPEGADGRERARVTWRRRSRPTCSVRYEHGA